MIFFETTISQCLRLEHKCMEYDTDKIFEHISFLSNAVEDVVCYYSYRYIIYMFQNALKIYRCKHITVNIYHQAKYRNELRVLHNFESKTPIRNIKMLIIMVFILPYTRIIFTFMKYLNTLKTTILQSQNTSN